MKAKIVLYDLEVSRDIVEGYGNKWEFKVVKTIRHQELMCFAYKWLDEKKTHYVSRHDFKTYKAFVQALADVLDEADIAIAHNGVKFDNRMANRFFIKADVLPPSPYKSIDTLQVARSVFKFQSNSLRELGSYLELGDKESVTYSELEDDFMSKKPNSRTHKLMKKYNVQDVILLERIYLKFRPYIKNHPNLGTYSQTHGTCPKCGSDHLQSRGTQVSSVSTYRRLQCQNCGGWSKERLNDKTVEKPDVTNI